MLTGMSAQDLSFLAPYHRTISRLDEQHRTVSRPDEPSERTSLELKHSSDGPPPATSPESALNENDGRRGTRGHQRLVFTDPVAFRYLEEDPGTIVLDRRRRIKGYEMYIVEQWACSRVHPTFIICTYTGDMSHSTLVNVLGIPLDESTWSPRLKIYFQAVSQFHARKKDTPLGTLMVTNLSGFPSALTVIAVPDGDVKKHREDFIVNEDLKRMGCSGRAGLNLQAPLASTVAKFHHLYRTSESVDLYPSVMELVRLCQTALMMFGKLLPAYVDGLLCDFTEKAINDWWTDIGAYFYNLEPSDGILGPTTVAGLLGLLIGAYNRLKAAGAPVGKDVTDVASMKRAIGAFQRVQRMEKTRRLDRQTLDKLHRATANKASGEGWTVPKAVKSTVAELSGKGGEMVMGIVGGREKAGIAEVETLDLDRLAQLVTGPKMKWLWQGKPIKSAGSGVFGTPTDELNGRVFSTDNQGNFMWTSSKRDSIADQNLERRQEMPMEHSGESRSGLGRLRDAVSGKSHHPRQIKEEDEPLKTPHDVESAGPRKSAEEPRKKPDHILRSPDSFDRKPIDPFPFNLALASTKDQAKLNRKDPSWRGKSSEEDLGSLHHDHTRRVDSDRSKTWQNMLDLRAELDDNAYQHFSSDFRYEGPRTRRLKRSQSAVQLFPMSWDTPRHARNPRHLSFSGVESTVLTYEDLLAEATDAKEDKEVKPAAAIVAQEVAAVAAQRKMKQIMYIQRARVPYVEMLVDNVENLDREAGEHLEELNSLYYQRLEEYQALRATSTDVVGDEKAALTESLRRVEMLGAKLDYEVNALQSRVQEVEDSVGEFERNVLDIEARVKELTTEQDSGNSWYYQAMTKVLGVISGGRTS